MKKISVSSALALCMICIALTFTVTAASFQAYYATQLERQISTERQFSKLFKANQLVLDNYIGDIDNENVLDSVMHGYMSGLQDKYGYYLDKNNTKALFEELDGKAEGIGIKVMYDEKSGCPLIVDVTEGSPAQLQGIMPGDLIVTVEGQDVLQIGYYSAVDKLRGKINTPASFSVKRLESEIFFTVTRSSFLRKFVDFRIIDEQIGYIKISEFNTPVPNEVKNAVKELKAQGAKSFVFDLRNNIGGELTSICEVLDYILPEGPILKINYKTAPQEIKYSDDQSFGETFCVLVNQKTYSAAELFAAAVKDYKAGTVIGEKTYGKGQMQTVMNLDDGTAISFTTATYDPPYSSNFDGIGVLPDILVSNSDLSADNQLQTAISTLKNIE